MYEEYFRFSSSPFRLSPDPRFFYGSRSHNKAMAYLHYGLRQGEGFIVITGEIGAGKSMLIGHLIDQLDRSNVVAAQLLTANLEANALLAHILSAFRIEPAGEGESAAIEAFEDFLFDQMSRGRRVLLIVDEAQNLPKRTIEELRMLSNIDYDGTPLFQVFLVGQPEFKGLMAAPDMEQLRQRVIASYHLEPLSRGETKEYIKHRLEVAGWNNDPTVSEDALDAVYAATGGVPRKINRLCNRVFLSCAIEKKHSISLETVEYVVADMAADGLEAPNEARGDETARVPVEKQEEDTQAAVAAEEEEKGDDKKVVVNGEQSSPDQKPPVVVPFAEIRKIRSDAGKAAPKRASANAKVRGAGKSEGAARSTEITDSDLVAGVETKPSVSDDKVPAQASSESEAEMAEGSDSVDGETRIAATAPSSVFDRLRAAKSGESAAKAVGEKRAPASLSDVARAIEEAAANANGESISRNYVELEDAAAGDLPDEITPLQQGDPKIWKASIIRTLDDARAELKTAHRNVARLRRRLVDLEKARHDRRAQIAANLTRAEELLAEIRDVWR